MCFFCAFWLKNASFRGYKNTNPRINKNINSSFFNRLFMMKPKFVISACCLLILSLCACSRTRDEKLATVKELNLSKQNLTTLPPNLGDYIGLETLYADENQLAKIVDEVGELEKLTELDLSLNKLNSLPDALANAKNLEKLDLSKNQLTTLPPVVLKLAKLQRLDLRNNQLSTLPPEIAQLSKLETVYLDGNQFTDAQRAEFRNWCPRTKFVWSENKSLQNK
jgi:Leucine-rich repeat (LRR) protein